MMKKVIFVGLVLMVSMTAMAQEVMDDGSRVLLPLEVQQCNLPNAPPPIPEGAVKEDLLKAQKNTKVFQTELIAYRTCMGVETEDKLKGLKDRGDLSQGNIEAIYKAYDYSVEMETRVADMFNEALRAYKAAQAGQ